MAGALWDLRVVFHRDISLESEMFVLRLQNEILPEVVSGYLHVLVRRCQVFANQHIAGIELEGVDNAEISALLICCYNEIELSFGDTQFVCVIETFPKLLLAFDSKTSLRSMCDSVVDAVMDKWEIRTTPSLLCLMDHRVVVHVLDRSSAWVHEHFPSHAPLQIRAVECLVRRFRPMARVSGGVDWTRFGAPLSPSRPISYTAVMLIANFIIMGPPRDPHLDPAWTYDDAHYKVKELVVVGEDDSLGRSDDPVEDLEMLRLHMTGAAKWHKRSMPPELLDLLHNADAMKTVTGGE